jgi:hypothetical protein
VVPFKLQSYNWVISQNRKKKLFTVKFVGLKAG